MLAFLTGLHIFISIILIILVLIQDSKGDAMGALGGGGGGGGSNSLFGATGATTFLAKMTRGAAIIFAATSIGLAIQTTTKNDSVIDGYVPPAATQVEAPAADSGKAAGQDPKAITGETKKQEEPNNQ